MSHFSSIIRYGTDALNAIAKENSDKAVLVLGSLYSIAVIDIIVVFILLFTLFLLQRQRTNLLGQSKTQQRLVVRKEKRIVKSVGILMFQIVLSLMMFTTISYLLLRMVDKLTMAAWEDEYFKVMSERVIVPLTKKGISWDKITVGLDKMHLLSLSDARNMILNKLVTTSKNVGTIRINNLFKVLSEMMTGVFGSITDGLKDTFKDPQTLKAVGSLVKENTSASIYKDVVETLSSVVGSWATPLKLVGAVVNPTAGIKAKTIDMLMDDMSHNYKMFYNYFVLEYLQFLKNMVLGSIGTGAVITVGLSGSVLSKSYNNLIEAFKTTSKKMIEKQTSTSPIRALVVQEDKKRKRKPKSSQQTRIVLKTKMT